MADGKRAPGGSRGGQARAVTGSWIGSQAEAGENLSHTQIWASLPGWPGATGSVLLASWMPGAPAYPSWAFTLPTGCPFCPWTAWFSARAHASPGSRQLKTRHEAYETVKWGAGPFSPFCLVKPLRKETDAARRIQSWGLQRREIRGGH